MHYLLLGILGEIHHLSYWNQLGNMMKKKVRYENKVLHQLLVKLMLEYIISVWARRLLKLNTRITQTYHPVAGDAGPGQPPLQRENLAL